MTDKQKTTPEEPRTPFEGMPFAAMMRKMMGRRGPNCGCTTPNAIPHMMAMCDVVWGETKEESVADVNQKT